MEKKFLFELFVSFVIFSGNSFVKMCEFRVFLNNIADTRAVIGCEDNLVNELSTRRGPHSPTNVCVDK